MKADEPRGTPTARRSRDSRRDGDYQLKRPVMPDWIISGIVGFMAGVTCALAFVRWILSGVGPRF